MRYIHKDEFEVGKKYHLSEEFDFSKEEIDPLFIRKIKDCHAEIDIENFSSILRVRINILANVVLPCAYTLEDVDYVLKGNEEFDFVDQEELADNESLFYEADDICLDDYVFSLLVALVPLRVYKKGAKLPPSGKGYRVMTEKEYYEEKAKKPDSRWDKLDELEFDED